MVFRLLFVGLLCPRSIGDRYPPPSPLLSGIASALRRRLCSPASPLLSGVASALRRPIPNKYAISVLVSHLHSIQSSNSVAKWSRNAELTDDEISLSSALGWCIEWVCASWTENRPELHNRTEPKFDIFTTLNLPSVQFCNRLPIACCPHLSS